MTLLEFKNEFRFKYDAASSGGPDLNSYEISLCLTQAAKDIALSAYSSYETSEISKRILAPLIEEDFNSLELITDEMTNFKAYLGTYSTRMDFLLREEIKLKSCIANTTIESVDIDNLTSCLNNPFKRPNSRKVIRVEFNKEKFKIYSELEVDKYKTKYITKDLPIIIEDFTTDPELNGDESIEGINVESITKLPSFIHDEIIDKAVIIAIKSTRENSLQSQVQLK